MYYLYDKTSHKDLPSFDFIYANFEDFYMSADVLTISLYCAYNICIKSESYDKIKTFVRSANQYKDMNIYIEVNKSLLEYIQLYNTDISTIDTLTDYEVYEELVKRYGVLFDKGCAKKLYFGLEHTYSVMEEAIQKIASLYPAGTLITYDILTNLFVLENTIYPRQVCIQFIRMDRWRWQKFNKCKEQFNNDMITYSIRKNCRKFLKDKYQYLKSGVGSNLIKTLPIENIIKMLLVFDYNRRGFMDVEILLNMYERGDNVNDLLSKRTS